MPKSDDDISSIHRRYSLTLLSPSSLYQSLILSVAVVSVLVVVTGHVYLQNEEIWLTWSFVITILLATQYIDCRFTKNKEYSKALHLSLFGNGLWLLTALVGLLSTIILSRPEFPILFITEGMFLFAGLRIGIFTTVLGLRLSKAWLVCFIQPLAIFLAMIPSDMWLSAFTDAQALVYGAVFLCIASVWSALTDRAGRPGVKSTHKLLQAYLVSLSKGNVSEMESMMVERANTSKVSTPQIRFHTKTGTKDFRIVLPEIHPGPFHPVGGSNIPYLIYKNLNSSAMIMHSVSDHTLNLPSKQEVEQYLENLSKSRISQEGLQCTEPLTIQVNKARAVGMLFGKSAILFLSLSPHGMEDLPVHVKSEIEQYSKNRNFERVFIVDCHNAMGEVISKIDSDDLLSAGKSCLDNLITKETFPLKFGYANSNTMNLNVPDIAKGGIGILCLYLNNKKYFLGWADANNMKNGIREEIVKHFSDNGYNLIEICTSDTHYSQSLVRNKMGYFELGKVTQPRQIAKWFFEIAKKAEKNIEDASFEILENQTEVKVMGPGIFRDFSKALENSLQLTKGFVAGCVGFFILTMFL